MMSCYMIIGYDVIVSHSGCSSFFSGEKSLQFFEALYTITLHNLSVYICTRKPTLVVFYTVIPILAVPNSQLLTRRHLQTGMDMHPGKQAVENSCGIQEPRRHAAGFVEAEYYLTNLLSKW